MFYNCYSLKSLNLSSFDTSSVTNMGYMFYNCSSLKTLNIDQFNVSLAEDLQYMFSECSSLISLNLTNFYTISNTNDFTGMFSNCNKNLKYCINDNLSYNDKFIDTLKIFQKNCSDICITMNYKKYIMEKYLCIDDCSLDNEYTYDYNNICYKPKKSYGFIIAGVIGLIIIIIISIFLLKKNKKLLFKKKSSAFFSDWNDRGKTEEYPGEINTELVEKKSLL